MLRTPRDAVVGRVIDAAEVLLAAGGVAAVSIREVATSAGVSPQTIFNRFVNRDTLLDDIAYRGWKRLAAQLVAVGSADVDEMIGQVQLFAQENSHLYRLMTLGPLLGVPLSDRTRATALGVIYAIPPDRIAQLHGSILLDAVDLGPDLGT